MTSQREITPEQMKGGKVGFPGGGGSSTVSISGNP